MEEGFLVEVRLSLFWRASESPLGKKTERENEQTQMQGAVGGLPENYGWLEPQSSDRRYSGGQKKERKDLVQLAKGLLRELSTFIIVRIM